MVEPGLGLQSDYEHIGHIYSPPLFLPWDIRGYSRKLFQVRLTKVFVRFNVSMTRDPGLVKDKERSVFNQP